MEEKIELIAPIYPRPSAILLFGKKSLAKVAVAEEHKPQPMPCSKRIIKMPEMNGYTIYPKEAVTINENPRDKMATRLMRSRKKPAKGLDSKAAIAENVVIRPRAILLSLKVAA